MHTECRWEDLKERDCLEDISVDGRVMDNKNPQTGFIWLRTETSSRVLSTS